MPANFLHGIETLEFRDGVRPINPVKSAVIGLVGIAPVSTGPEKTILVQSEREAAQFGIPAAENTIATALQSIFAQGPAVVLVVNVFDPSNPDHIQQGVSQTYDVLGGKFKVVDFLPVGNVVVRTTTGSPATLTLNTDYTYNELTQVVTILNRGTYPDGTTLEFECDALTDDLSQIDSADIIGATLNGESTGLKRFESSFIERGFVPRILDCPWFSDRQEVANEMETRAISLKAHALIHTSKNATVAQALAGRGSTAGLVKSFQRNSKRSILCYPFVTIYETLRNQNTDAPLTSFMAGVMAATDLNEGYWVSPSNHNIRGILGTNRPITWAVNSSTTDANLLNEKGIVTVAAGYATGYLLWGNSSAQWDTDTYPDHFICVQRTCDVVHESITQAMLPFIDKPITPGIIDAIKESGNAFIRKLIADGALTDGIVKFLAANNPDDQIALGHLTFDIELAPSLPLQRLTFQSFINQQMYRRLTADAA